MPVFETFSKRKKKAELAGKSEPYAYDALPTPLRRQIIHIWNDAFGNYREYDSYSMRSPSYACTAWKDIYDMLARELGVFGLAGSHLNAFEQCQEFVIKAEVDNALDLVEISFLYLDRITRELNEGERRINGIRLTADEAIEELNQRFKEHAIGYQLLGGKIVRVDSEYIHAEVVRPALRLLWQAEFAGPAEEFLSAHEHYRAGRRKEAIVDAQKPFESTLKAICDKRGWPYASGARSQRLVEIVLEKGLVPSYLNSELGALRSILESALPTVRNKDGAHGQGTEPIVVPEYLCAFALHVAAANIVLLVQAHGVSP